MGVKYVFTWHLKNVSMCPLKIEEKIESPLFQAENISKGKWFLSFYPRGDDSDDDMHVSCYLHKVEKDRKEKIDFELEMIGNDGVVIQSKSCVKSGIDNEGWGWKNFLAIDTLKSKMENWMNDILTIRCKMIGYSTSANQPAIEGVAQSTICVDRCCLEWNVGIPESPMWKEEKVLFLSKKSHFKLTISAPEVNFEFEIRRMNEIVSGSQYIACKISLISLTGNEIKSKVATYLFDDGEVSWKFPTFFSKIDLLTRARNYIRNNIFILKCEISASTGEIVSEVLNVTHKFSSPAETSLNDMNPGPTYPQAQRNLLKSLSKFDVKLRVEGSLFQVQDILFSAQSPVFKAMFEQSRMENEARIIDIQDLDRITFKSLTQFLYFGSVREMDFEKSMKLLIAANKFQIPSLTEKCSVFLSSVLTVGNVCDVYAVADMINHNDLKSSAQQFIQLNSAEVLRSAAWSDWVEGNMKLANEILTKLALNSIH